jgi:hypothetical protein
MPQRLEELALDLIKRLRHERSPEDFSILLLEQLKNLSDSGPLVAAKAPESNA